MGLSFEEIEDILKRTDKYLLYLNSLIEKILIKKVKTKRNNDYIKYNTILISFAIELTEIEKFMEDENYKELKMKINNGLVKKFSPIRY